MVITIPQIAIMAADKSYHWYNGNYNSTDTVEVDHSTHVLHNTGDWLVVMCEFIQAKCLIGWKISQKLVKINS